MGNKFRFPLSLRHIFKQVIFEAFVPLQQLALAQPYGPRPAFRARRALDVFTVPCTL